MRTIPYKREEGGIQACVRMQKKFFWTTKTQNFPFFVQKKLLHYHLLLCIEQRAKGKCVRLRAMGEERA